jgi:hypothetical protein
MKHYGVIATTSAGDQVRLRYSPGWRWFSPRLPQPLKSAAASKLELSANDSQPSAAFEFRLRGFNLEIVGNNL